MWICGTGFQQAALLQRLEFCRGFPLSFGFLILKVPLPLPAKGSFTSQLQSYCRVPLHVMTVSWFCLAVLSVLPELLLGSALG